MAEASGSEGRITSLGQTDDPKEALGWLAEKLENEKVSSVFLVVERDDGDGGYSMKGFGGVTKGFICYTAALMNRYASEDD